MSPRRSINSLKTASTKALAAFLLQTLSGDEGLFYEEISEIFVGATFDVIEQLLEDIVGEELHDAATRFNCLQVLLREDIRKLSTGMFPQFYYLKIIETIKLNGTGLQYLNLKGIWARENTKEVSNMLENLKKLRILISPHIVDDLVLQQIIKLDKLTSLDITGDCTYSLNLLRQFKSDTCQVLSIGMYGLKELYSGCDHAESISTVANLIRNLPNLRVIKSYSYSGEALYQVYAECPQFKTRLAHIHDTGMTVERWQVVDEVCPKLESVRLTGPKEGFVGGSLDNPERKLKSLKLCYPQVNELYPLITSANLPLYNLHTLHISYVRSTAGTGPAYLDVSLLCMACPNLQDLECHKVQLKYAQHEDAYFVQLETVEVRHCDISINVIGFLLLNSPFIRRAIIIDNCQLTDGDIFRLCADSEFLNLEELCFAYAGGLTVTSVELLMRHCPKLRALGQLSQWNIKDTELVELSNIIQQSNVDLALAQLLWHGSRTTNFAGILSQGLRIAPPEAPASGFMFGKGIYFADMVTKSAQYCWVNPGKIGLLLLCDVALGTPLELRRAQNNIQTLPYGNHSLKGIGNCQPDLTKSERLPGNVEVPLGAPKERVGLGVGLAYNEYIVLRLISSISSR